MMADKEESRMKSRVSEKEKIYIGRMYVRIPRGLIAVSDLRKM